MEKYSKCPDDGKLEAILDDLRLLVKDYKDIDEDRTIYGYLTEAYRNVKLARRDLRDMYAEQ